MPEENTDKKPDVEEKEAEKQPENLGEAIAMIAAQATQIAELTGTVNKLLPVAKELEDTKKAQAERDEAAAKEKGDFEKLYGDEKTKNEQLVNENNKRQRVGEVSDAVIAAKDLPYPTNAVLKTAKRLDAETGHELAVEDLIKKTVEELEGMGLVATPETLAIGGGAGTGVNHSRDPKAASKAKMDELKKKAAEGDRTAYNQYIVERAKQHAGT
jgi:hypothetical protein